MSRLLRLRDDQWQRIEALLPPQHETGARPAKPHRPIVEAMIWVLRTGAPWRDVPVAAGELLADIHDAYVVGDSAYSAKGLVDAWTERGCEVVILAQPTHTRRPFDRHTYRERHLVESFFQRIKRFRRIAMRFEQLAPKGKELLVRIVSMLSKMC